jgi:hypothetical protein
MKPKYDALTAGADRLNALLGWWGAPIASGNGKMDGQMKLLRRLASDLQKTCRDAYSGQMEGLFSSNERLIHSCRELLRSRQLQEVMTAESDILATFLESASAAREAMGRVDADAARILCRTGARCGRGALSTKLRRQFYDGIGGVQTALLQADAQIVGARINSDAGVGAKLMELRYD